MKANMSGFVNVNGRTVWVDEGEDYDAGHEYVTARPDVFGAPGPVRAVNSGEIEEVDPTISTDPDEFLDEQAAGLTTQNAAPIIRKPRQTRARKSG
jgi:hypothetical protein